MSSTDLNCENFRDLYARGSQDYTECRTLERAAKAGTAAASWRTLAEDLQTAQTDIATNLAAIQALTTKNTELEAELAKYQTLAAANTLAGRVTDLETLTTGHGTRITAVEESTADMLTATEVTALRTLNGDFAGAVSTAVAPILAKFEDDLLEKIPEGLNQTTVKQWITDSAATITQQIADLKIPELKALVDADGAAIEAIQDALDCAADTLGETCALRLA